MELARPRIAVLDDEKPVRKALERLIRSAGMAVEAFASGGDFLDRLTAHHWDCLILDLHMSGVNGFEVQAFLKACGSQLPVVVITGHDTPEARARAMVGGACAYLLKPVDEQALLHAISEAVSRNEPPP